ncbi:MAG TPA: DUF1318 domain-containing protein [Geobacteraceae bacterium]
MRRTIGKLLVAGVGALLAACMSITVNVYFPEKDVKQAYKSLDEMLLKHGEGKGAEPAGGGEEKPAEPPAGEKPQSFLKGGQFSFAFITEAQAAENVADTLAIEISSLPEALKAYEEMKARQPQLNALRDQGIVGETYQGLVTVRDAKRIGDKQPLVKAENDNRKTVITAMAKAILRINKQPETRGNMNQVFPKAAATFAETRREEARPGWWIEVVKGRWVQK